MVTTMTATLARWLRAESEAYLEEATARRLREWATAYRSRIDSLNRLIVKCEKREPVAAA